jgi:hypothetical protein
MSERDRGDRPKKSWREMDAMRDKPRSSSPRPEAGRSRAQEERASKAYRAQLDALFERGEVGKFAEKMAQSRADAPASLLGPPMPAPKPKDPEAAPAPPPEPKPDDPRSILRKKILTAIGREEISRAVDKYVKAHGMPRDFEVLEQALEHQKEERLTEAMTVLESMLEKGEKPKRSRTLVGKLRFVEETSGDAELVALAARVRQKLG